VSWSEARKPRNRFDRAVNRLAGFALAVAVVVGLLWLSVRAAGTGWAILVAGLAVAAVFAADRMTWWRCHAPQVGSRSRASVRVVGSARPGRSGSAPANTDWQDAA
jgi:ABC-type transport system involved in cytochrome bd biosynthesis fused ATPase/permease subunit